MDHYSLITPCGLDGIEVTSLRELLGKEPDRTRVRDTVSRHFQQVFDIELVRMDMEDLNLKVTPEIPLPFHSKLSGG
jgi:lipoate-protein ligase B